MGRNFYEGNAGTLLGDPTSETDLSGLHRHGQKLQRACERVMYRKDMRAAYSGCWIRSAISAGCDRAVHRNTCCVYSGGRTVGIDLEA